MTINANSDAPASGVESQQKREQSGGESPVKVEQADCHSVRDIPMGLTKEFMERNGVREMLKNFQIREVPAHYIKPESVRQDSHPIVEVDSPLNDLPVVDLASPQEDLVRDIGKACEWGFFQIVNHGTSPDLLRRMSKECEDFFFLPAEEKIRCTTPAKVAGPIHFGGGSGGDWREVLKINLAPASNVASDHWPVQPVGFRKTILEYTREQEKLVRRLMEIVSEALGLERDYVSNECGEETRMLMAINHYPPCPDPSLTMGIREHSDPNTLTVLQQDQVGGLQVWKDGKWFSVEPLKNALVVNAGDHLQILSNGRYPSVLHRVVNNKFKTRTSIALFLSPGLTAHIKPAPALVDEEHPARYREFVFGQFMKEFYSRGGPNKKTTLNLFQSEKQSTA